MKRAHAPNKSIRVAKKIWGPLERLTVRALRALTEQHGLDVTLGDVILLNGAWYVTHAGLLRIARIHRCCGINVGPMQRFCDAQRQRWVFKAVVYRTKACKGFVGYGDADPSNVSSIVHGAEMRVAETRAVNRALRKAYGIGICSVEEIGSVAQLASPAQAGQNVRKLTPESAHSNRNNGHGSNGNVNGVRVRDRLCQVIRQHALDAELVKSYAIDFCGTNTLREASREQVENFVVHLADWAEKDRSALLCQLKSYSRPQAGAA
jgi:hypothetical protein